MLGTVVVPANSTFAAGNIKDREYSYAYPGDGGDFSVGSRKKMDYTSHYIKNNDKKIRLRLSSYATGKPDKRGYSLIKNCSTPGEKIVGAGQYKYVTNYVKEWGYKYCTLVCTPETHNAHTFRGVWSPDSI